MAILLLCIGAGTFTYHRAQNSIKTDRELDRIDQLGINIIKKIFYPKERELTNSLGKKINAIIVGKSPEQIVLKKESDASEKIFYFKIAHLSTEDQSFIEDLPLTEKNRKNEKVAKRKPLKGKFSSGKLNQKKPFGSGLPFQDKSILVPESANDGQINTTRTDQ